MQINRVPIAKAIRFTIFELVQGISRIVIFPPIRRILWMMAGAGIGSGTVILDARFVNCYHYGLSRVLVGRDVFIGNDVSIDTRGGVRIENQATLADRVNIVTHINVGFPDHPLQKKYPTSEKPVTIGRGSYVGTGAIILPGVTIGAESLIGAGAVVTKSIPPRSVAVGVPAKVIKKL